MSRVKEDKVHEESRGIRVTFPPGKHHIVANTRLPAGSAVQLYTTDKGGPVSNYCEKCHGMYYSIESIDEKHLMSISTRICKCPHSDNVTLHLVPM